MVVKHSVYTILYMIFESEYIKIRQLCEVFATFCHYQDKIIMKNYFVFLKILNFHIFKINTFKLSWNLIFIL